MKRILICLSLVAGSLYPACMQAENVTLVRNGKALAAIVLEAKPTRSAQMAAYELQHVVQLMSGVTLPIVTQLPAGIFPIYLGPEKEAKFTGEQYEVTVKKDHIRLGGNDSKDYARVDYQKERTFPGVGYNWKTPRQIYNYHSTLLAVYDFLETLLGVRFYSFGDEGIVYKKNRTLKVPLFTKRFESPTDAFRYAGLAYRDSVRKTTPRERLLLALRWRMNTLYGEVNHTTDSLIYRYWGPARGKGQGGIGLYLYSSYGKSAIRRHGVTSRTFAVTPEKKSYSITIDTVSLPARYFDILRCRPFLIAQKGSRVCYSDVKISVENPKK